MRMCFRRVCRLEADRQRAAEEDLRESGDDLVLLCNLCALLYLNKPSFVLKDRREVSLSLSV